MGSARPLRPPVADMTLVELQNHLRGSDHDEAPPRNRVELVTRHRRLHALGATHGHERVAAPEVM